MDTSAPPGRLYPNISPSSDGNNDEVVYSPVVCPTSSRPSLPTEKINMETICFKIIEIGDGDAKLFFSLLTIGREFKVSSFPDGGNTAQEAMEIAAKLAYKSLINNMKILALPITQDTSEALKRILRMLKEHPNGVWANKIPDEYTDKYKEQLPNAWLKQTLACPQVDLDIISDKKIILTLKESKAPHYQPHHILPCPGTKVTGGTLQDNSPRVLSQPKLPCIGGYLDVNVTLAASPGNFVVQPWETGPQLKEMMIGMQSFYSAHSLQLQPLTSAEVCKGGMYASLHSDAKWYRVQVTSSILKGDHLTVVFVDFGNHTMINVAKLRYLPTRFCKLPCQAIKAKLSGIHPNNGDWSLEDCFRFRNLVCNHQFVSIVEAMNNGSDLINPSDTILGLRLIDTSNDLFDVDISELLIKEERALLDE